MQPYAKRNKTTVTSQSEERTRTKRHNQKVRLTILLRMSGCGSLHGPGVRLRPHQVRLQSRSLEQAAPRVNNVRAALPLRPHPEAQLCGCQHVSSPRHLPVRQMCAQQPRDGNYTRSSGLRWRVVAGSARPTHQHLSNVVQLGARPCPVPALTAFGDLRHPADPTSMTRCGGTRRGRLKIAPTNGCGEPCRGWLVRKGERTRVGHAGRWDPLPQADIVRRKCFLLMHDLVPI